MVDDKNIAVKTAQLLLEVQAVKLNPDNPYTWSSGWNSPIYCDNRITLSFPEVRTFIKESLLQLIKNNFENTQMIAGVATAGIPHGALIADELNLPFCYVRSSPKSHGLTNQVEGKLIPNQKTLVVEDLISTGGSSLSVVDVLRKQEADVCGLIAIFDYGFDAATENFKSAGVRYKTLTNYEILIQAAIEMKYIDSSKLSSLNTWRKNPAAWLK